MTGTKRSRQDRDQDDHTPVARDRNDATSTTTAAPAPLPLHRASNAPPAKRPRTRAAQYTGLSASSLESADYLSSLSDELLIRILAHLSLPCLLSVAPVSRRFHRLSDDSQLWKAIYYQRFVLPRAIRIPGSRGGALATTPNTAAAALQEKGQTTSVASPGLHKHKPLNWKQNYKLRHNWARGKCAVKELFIGGEQETRSGVDLSKLHSHGLEANCGDSNEHDSAPQKMLVKVVEGIAITADRARGLRVWELKSRSLVAHKTFTRTTQDGAGASRNSKVHELHTGIEKDVCLTPTSLAVSATACSLDIAVGLFDGGFDIWHCDLVRKTLIKRFAHPASSNGPLIGIAYAHPYVLTATDSVLVSLYVFGTGRKPTERAKHGASKPQAFSLTGLFDPPHLLTSLRSHTSQPPLALSIRKVATVVVASIAYTFATRQGWSVGIQDLHVKTDSASGSNLPTIDSTRLAYSPLVNSSTKVRGHGNSARAAFGRTRGRSPPGSLRSRMYNRNTELESSPPVAQPNSPLHGTMDGPIALCYSHPYLLATMPDNTLILHLCTSSASSLAISSGIRLWGHTSGISGAEITARGKAVSVSMRGEEMRVWELEGRPAAERGRSVAIRPTSIEPRAGSCASQDDGGQPEPEPASYDWDERRNWAGFDDEMVIVLKESRGGRESLMVYDFT